MCPFLAIDRPRFVAAKACARSGSPISWAFADRQLVVSKRHGAIGCRSASSALTLYGRHFFAAAFPHLQEHVQISKVH